jgi:nucleotidyltransferase/DNA polymerase involved in DNA repair
MAESKGNPGRTEFWTRGAGHAILSWFAERGEVHSVDEHWVKNNGRTLFRRYMEAAAAEEARNDADLTTLEGVGGTTAEKLKEAGYNTVGDLDGVTEEQLQEAGLTKTAIAKVLKALE